MEIELFRKCLGQRIKEFRNSLNYTQEQFCEIIGIEQPNLSNIEQGRTFPSYPTLHTIIDKCGADPAFLFGFMKNVNKKEYSSLDFEILGLLFNIPEEMKTKIKRTIELWTSTTK